MPLVDLPLEELQAYTGRNPRPADLDEYWAKALEEMRALDPQVCCTPAAFQAPGAECFDLTFTGVGGARVYAKYMRPLGKSACPAILQFHGYAGNSGDWSDKLRWIQAGFCVAALDCRGQGGRSEDSIPVRGNTLRGHIIRGVDDAPEKLYYRSVFLDTVQLADIVMAFPEVDSERVGACGGSQGGGLTLACAALHSGIKRAVPWYPFLSDYRRVWELDLAKQAYEEINAYFRLFDPTHAHADEFFLRLGYIDVSHLAPRIKAEVLMSTGLMDSVCPPSTQFAAYNRIVSKKRMVIYPDFGHEGLPGFSDQEYAFLLGL